MVTLFDQEKVWEIHDYNVAQAAKQEGMETGIRAMITTLQELSFSQEDAAQKLASKFALPFHIAETKVKQYWIQ